MSAKSIVAKFGGQTKLAALIGKGQPTVSYWVKTNRIPAKWQSILLELAKTQGIALSSDDFMSSIKDHELPSNTSELAETKVHEPIQQSTLISTETSLTQTKDSPAAIEPDTHFLFYASHDGAIKVQVIIGDETVWASQKGMAEIFGTSRENITIHLGNVFSSGELDENSVCKEFLLTGSDGKNYNYKMYNLDAIISIGYRVSSYQATQFRKWATGILKEYLIKGFTLDDDRLKQGNQLFGKDYFDELLDRVREIRASERRFYQKITDIYSQCSIDYDKDAPITHQFYSHVQDKLHYAIHGHTSAELIYKRADASKPHMGLSTYKNAKNGGKITRADVTVGKNYLNEKEIDELNRVVSMYLDFAEGFARRHIPMRMQDWAEKLDGFLEFNAYEVLKSYGNVKRDTAEKIALSEYEKFRVIQDREYKSDFDKVVDELKVNKRLPKKSDH